MFFCFLFPLLLHRHHLPAIFNRNLFAYGSMFRMVFRTFFYSPFRIHSPFDLIIPFRFSTNKIVFFFGCCFCWCPFSSSCQNNFSHQFRVSVAVLHTLYIWYSFISNMLTLPLSFSLLVFFFENRVWQCPAISGVFFVKDIYNVVPMVIHQLPLLCGRVCHSYMAKKNLYFMFFQAHFHHFCFAFLYFFKHTHRKKNIFFHNRKHQRNRQKDDEKKTKKLKEEEKTKPILNQFTANINQHETFLFLFFICILQFVVFFFAFSVAGILFGFWLVRFCFFLFDYFSFVRLLVHMCLAQCGFSIKKLTMPWPKSKKMHTMFKHWEAQMHLKFPYFASSETKHQCTKQCFLTTKQRKKKLKSIFILFRLNFRSFVLELNIRFFVCWPIP